MRVRKLIKIKKFSLIQNQIIKLLLIIGVVLSLTWGVVKATEDELVNATNKFSVIGTVSSIKNDTLSLIDARGSDSKDETLYNLNITYLDTVETNNYEPRIITDLSVGDTIIAQGLTDGTNFFIKRIISFNTTTYTIEEHTTPTLEEFSTSTDVIENLDTSFDTSLIIDMATTSIESISTTSDNYLEEDTAEGGDSSLIETSTTTTDSTIEKISDIISDGLENVEDILNMLVDTVTSENEVETISNLPSI